MKAQTFSNWLNEKEEDDWSKLSDEELEKLVYYGLANKKELYARRAVGLSGEFFKVFDQLLRSLNIRPQDLSTDRQAKNGTRVIQFSGEQVAKLILSREEIPGLTPIKARKFKKMRDYLETAPDGSWNKSEFDQPRASHFWSHVQYVNYQYTITKSNIKYNYSDLTPSSTTIINFDGTLSASEILDEFIYRLAMDAYSIAKSENKYPLI